RRRWVPEAMFRMWSSGGSLVTWFSLEDQPLATSYSQTGMFYRGARGAIGDARPKPFLEGFRFPAVAFENSRGTFVWGRTPFGRAGDVRIEYRAHDTWRPLAALHANRYGIFRSTLRTLPRSNSVRAVFAPSGEASLPFSLTPVPDRFFN